LTESIPVNISRYEIKSLIGRGGMGDLYLARDPNTNRLVVVKLLNASLTSGDLRDRFAREARALAALNHPNIVIIYDYGEFQGSPFIVMEYVRGETLAEKIKRRATLTLGQKLKLMEELCAGLGQAHEAGIIHRDIKPANLMVEQQGRLKILDFGIARVAEGNTTRVGMQVTQVNVRIGTPGYMSPEQIEGGDIDQRSDVFAVGTVFYELLAYREAFSGGTTRQIENKVLEAQPAPLTALVQGLEPEIAAIVSRALEKDPNARFQDAAEFERALEQQRWRLGPTGHTPPPSRPTPQPAPTPGRSSRDARANAAYQRSLAVYQDGAEEAAKRFVIEALAEDPDHPDARALLARLDPDALSYVSPSTMRPATPMERTVASSRRGPAPTVVKTQAAMAARTENRYRMLWQQYRWPTTIVASLLAVALVVFAAIRVSGWLWASGHSLTISRPTGGTILAKGITCGTLGSDCSAQRDSGDMVELQVQADPGFVFRGYTGDCAPGGRTLMTGARTCGATFEAVPNATPSKVTRALTVTPPKGGTIVSQGITCGTLGSECTASHPDGTQVKLDVLADQGFLFARFTGACAPDGQTTMTEARTCGATFVPAQAPSGGQQAGGGGGGTLPPRAPQKPKPVEAPAVPTLPPPTGVAAGGGTTAPVIPTPGPPAGGPALGPIGPTEGPAPPPTPPDVTARNEIQKTLTQFCAAYEQLELAAIRRVFPTAPEALREQLKQYKSVECKLTGPPEYDQLDPAKGTAKVKVPFKQTFDLKVGGAQKPQETIATVALSRPEQRGTWYIDSVSHKPKK